MSARATSRAESSTPPPLAPRPSANGAVPHDRYEGVPDLPELVTSDRILSMLIGNNRWIVAALGFCSAVSAICESALLLLLVEIVTTTAKGASSTRLNLIDIHAKPGTLFLIVFALTLARIVLQAPLALLPAKIAADVQSRLRRDLFGVFSRASWDVQSRDREGYLQEMLTGQVAQATGGALQTTALVIAAFTFIILMSTAIALNVVAAVVILVGSLLLFGLLRPFNVLAGRLSKELSQAQFNYAQGVSEAGRVAEETQVFGTAGAQRLRIDELIARAQSLFYRSSLVNRLSPSLYQSAVILILVGGLYAIYKEGSGNFASLGGVVLIVFRAGIYGQQVQSSYQGLRTALPFIERLQENARRYADSIPVPGSERLDLVETIAFEHVTFGYTPERPVLKDMSFQVRSGEAVGIIGPSGAGKSTMIQILLQLRGPQDGRYVINGMAVQDFLREDWFRRVSYVPQQPRLLHATVAENIRFMRDIDDDAVRRAAELARIHDDVMSWADGYDTLVGPRVDAVSGGQQQRICLARALAAKPEVLVLDEPTSALDPHSERLIQASLQALRHEMTLFIIAHRMSTLDICDRVMVVVDGRLAAFDTIELLQQNSDYYRTASLLAAGATEGQLP
ncbi:MAG TPA: ABC transporter ATP-binding protein [Solirubrobacteraceae bacterium]|nr:ABC transporter ATP-binding protein [Solirubrobacteraceae bacterium]